LNTCRRETRGWKDFKRNTKRGSKRKKI